VLEIHLEPAEIVEVQHGGVLVIDPHLLFVRTAVRDTPPDARPSYRRDGLDHAAKFGSQSGAFIGRETRARPEEDNVSNHAVSGAGSPSY
jgi:hypothetical protein